MTALAESTSASPGWPTLRFLRDELTVSPARWSRMVRMTVVVMLITILSQALRVPSLGVSAFLVLFMASAADVVTSVRLGVGAMLAVTVAVILVLLDYSVALAEPALRVPLMAFAVFGAMYLTPLSPAGPLFWIIGFVCAYGLTFGDLGASPEKLTRSILWAWVFVAYPVAIIVLADVVFGKRPETLFRDGVAERLEAAAAYLAAPSGDPAARRRVERLERGGTLGLAAYAKAGPPSGAEARATILRKIDLLFVLLRELPADAASDPQVRAVLARAGEAVAEARRALLGDGADTAESFVALEGGGVATGGASAASLAVVLPLLACVEELGQAILEARKPAAADEPKAHGHAKVAVTQAQKTGAARFAAKTTLAAMIAYIFYVSADWSGIHTAMLTCLIVAQGSLGATIQKLSLRIIGAALGAALGILSIIFVLPHLETIGGLVVLVGAVTLFASWIATASQAISYAGVQLGFAFYLTVLQGFTRTSQMSVGRDRVIGIIIGNLLITVVFTSLWPVRIKPVVRQALSRAMEALAATLRLAGRAAPASEIRDAEIAIHTQLRVAVQNAPLRKLEPGEDDGWSLVPALGSLFVPIHAIAHQRVDVSALPPVEEEAAAALSESAAGWLSASATALATQRPLPSFQPAGAAIETLEAAAGVSDATATSLRLRGEWFGLLNAQIERLAGRAPHEVSS